MFGMSSRRAMSSLLASCRVVDDFRFIFPPLVSPRLADRVAARSGTPSAPDGPQIPFRRPPDRRLPVPPDHRIPKRSVHPLILEWIDRLHNPLDLLSRQGDVVGV